MDRSGVIRKGSPNTPSPVGPNTFPKQRVTEKSLDQADSATVRKVEFRTRPMTGANLETLRIKDEFTKKTRESQHRERAWLELQRGGKCRSPLEMPTRRSQLPMQPEVVVSRARGPGSTTESRSNPHSYSSFFRSRTHVPVPGVWSPPDRTQAAPQQDP